jgi:hypothetical protein
VYQSIGIDGESPANASDIGKFDMDAARCRAPVSLGAKKGYFDTEFHQLSHELRTPLNHINGFAELLLMDDQLSPLHANYVRAILNGSDALKLAVTGYLDRAQQPGPRCCGLAA